MREFFLIFALLGMMMVSIGFSQPIPHLRLKIILEPAEGIFGFSPDGKLLITNSSAKGGRHDGVAQFWDISTGKVTRVLLKNTDAEHDLLVMFSPDWQTVATWDFRGKREKQGYKLWDIRTEQLRATLGGKVFWRFPDYSPDNRYFAAASENEKTVKVWDVTNGQVESVLTDPQGERFFDLAYSPDGKLLAAVVDFDKVKIWDAATNQYKLTLVDDDATKFDGFKALKGFSHSDTIYAMSFSHDGRLLATVGRTRQARLWDVAAGKLKSVLRGHTGKVVSVAFSPDGKLLATGSTDKTARIWDAATGDLKATLRHKGMVAQILFSSYGSLVATFSDEKKFRLWDSSDGHLVAEIEGEWGGFAFSPDGKMFAVQGRKKKVFLFEL